MAAAAKAAKPGSEESYSSNLITVRPWLQLEGCPDLEFRLLSRPHQGPRQILRLFSWRSSPCG